MCDDPDQASMQKKHRFDKSKTCIKCKLNPGQVVIRHAVYCRTCFDPLIITKFRRSLDQSLHSGSTSGAVFLGFSGGAGSAVLMDLVFKNYLSPSVITGNEAKKQGTRKPPSRREKVWQKAYVGYVETCHVFPGVGDRTAEAQSLVERYPSYEFVPLRIEDAFDPAWWARLGNPTRELWQADFGILDLPLEPAAASTPLDSLRSFLSSLPTPTAVATMLTSITRLILLYAAKSRACSQVLLGNSMTSISISLISSISSGGGFSVVEEREEVWHGIRVIRPLRDVTSKECAAWLHWARLDVVGGGIVHRSDQGIGQLTRDFIVGLERDFPSTVSTISRTCGKLVSKSVSEFSCSLCERPAQSGVGEWKARTSIRTLSSDAPVKVPLVEKPLAPRLCYACHTALTSRKGQRGNTEDHAATLPAWVAPSTRADMKAYIGDFLIE